MGYVGRVSPGSVPTEIGDAVASTLRSVATTGKPAQTAQPISGAPAFVTKPVATKRALTSVAVVATASAARVLVGEKVGVEQLIGLTPRAMVGFSDSAGVDAVTQTDVVVARAVAAKVRLLSYAATAALLTPAASSAPHV